MLTVDKIRKRLDIQQADEGDTPNIRLLRAMLSHLKTASQWNALTNIRLKRYGDGPFQVHIYYDVAPSLLSLLEGLGVAPIESQKSEQ